MYLPYSTLQTRECTLSAPTYIIGVSTHTYESMLLDLAGGVFIDKFRGFEEVPLGSDEFWMSFG